MKKYLLLFITFIIIYIIYEGVLKNTKCNNVHFLNTTTHLKFENSEISTIKHEFKKHHYNNNPNLNFGNLQSKKMDYHQIRNNIPFLEAKLLTTAIEKEISNTFGKRMKFAPKYDENRIFLRMYDNENDHHNWHYDSNFTQGIKVTLIIPLFISRNNTSKFYIKNKNMDELIDISVGQGVYYNGSEVKHKISNQKKGEERLVAIVHLYENPNKNVLGVCRYNLTKVFKHLLSIH